METWDALRARRNVRSYQQVPIPAADLDRILEAGWQAPSASNRQHWDFVLSTDPAQLAELSPVWQGARHIAGAAAAISLVPARPGLPGGPAAPARPAPGPPAFRGSRPSRQVVTAGIRPDCAWAVRAGVSLRFAPSVAT